MKARRSEVFETYGVVPDFVLLDRTGGVRRAQDRTDLSFSGH